MFTSVKIKILLVVVAVVVVVGQLGWLSPAQDFFIWATGPVFRGVRNVTIHTRTAISNVFAIGDLREENIDLKNRLAMLETEAALLRANAAEYKLLEQALNLKERSGFNLTAARVVSVDPGSLNQALLLDRGASSGVVSGQAVVDAAGALIGRITRVLNNTSELTLLSDESSRLPAEVLESGAKGVAAGRHGLAVTLVEVPQGQTLGRDNRVVSTGFTPGVPAGLLIGYVDSLQSEPADLFQEALVRTAADLRQLRLVFIIIGSQ